MIASEGEDWSTNELCGKMEDEKSVRVSGKEKIGMNVIIRLRA